MKRQYKITPEGVFIQHTDGLFEGWEKIEKAEDLIGYAGDDLENEAPQEELHWTGAKIPMSVISPVIANLRNFPDFETGYKLFYNAAQGKWLIRCPKQFGCAANVFFENNGEPYIMHDINGVPIVYSQEGTIHTHPGMKAFWSTADLMSNSKRFGIHMVFGLNEEGRVVDKLITLFTPRKGFNIKPEDIFEANVDWNADSMPDLTWQETILAQFQSDFKLVVDGVTYGPHQKPKSREKDWKKIFEEQEKPVHKEKKPAVPKTDSKFLELMSDTYGYDTDRIMDWLFEDGVEGAEEVVYKQFETDGTLSNGIIASEEICEWLDGPPKEHENAKIYPCEWQLARTLRAKFMDTDWVAKAHMAEDLTKYQHELNVLFTFLDEDTLRVYLNDLSNQIEISVCCGGDDIPAGGRVISEDAAEWARKVLNSSSVLSDPNLPTASLWDALWGCASRPVPVLTWRAMALLLTSFGNPLTCVWLYELRQRMKKEGKLTCLAST